MPFSIRPRQRDPGPGEREQTHTLQVSCCLNVCVRREGEEEMKGVCREAKSERRRKADERCLKLFQVFET